MVRDTAGRALTASATLRVRTSGTNQFIDLTSDIEKIVSSSGVEEGICVVASPHTTCALLINEDEGGFIEDLISLLERLVPKTGNYKHDLAAHALEEEGPNGYAHLRAALLSSSSVTIPVREGRMLLGTWQRIFFVELDRSRNRRVEINIVGREQ